MELIQDRQAFADLITELRSESVVGIDTEAASFHRYVDRVYLLQVSSRVRTAVVDPLAVDGLPGLDEFLRDSSVEHVFHDADYDLRLLHHEFGYRLHGLFDTRVAAQFANEPAIGLGALLERYFQVRTDKRFQRADWSARPLTPPMIAYAATDTRFLPALRDRLRDDLTRLGRLAWVEEECELLTRVEWSGDGDPDNAFLRMKGARVLDRRGLAVLREVFAWRGQLALKLDRALFRIMSNETLIALAQERPATLDALGRIKGVGREIAARHGSEILAAIARGVSVPDEVLPRFERGSRPRPDPAYEVRLERLRALRVELAPRINLLPGLLCPNGTLEAIARAFPKTVDELREVRGVRRWQAETFGAELVRALNP